MEGDMFGLGETPVEEVVDVAQEPIEAPAEQPGEPAPVAEVPPGTVSIPEPKPEPGYVPLAAVLDEREKRKALETQLEQLRASQAPKPEPIDPWTDLDGALSQRDQQYQAMLHQQKTQMSRRFAEIQYGKDTVEEAYKWAVARCDSDPIFNQQVYMAEDPVGFAVQQYQRDQIASTVTMDDFKAFQAWKQAQSNPQPVAAVPVPPEAQAPAPLPPRSLVTAQNAGAPTLPKTTPEEERLAKMF